MKTPRITNLAVARPPHLLRQEDAARRIADATGEPRRVWAIANGSLIEQRAISLEPDCIGRLGTIAERNAVYEKIAPPLAIEVARQSLASRPVTERIGHVVASSCTGYMVPGWDVQLVEELALGPNTVRLPLTQSGCAGGVVALSRAADYVFLHSSQAALVVAAELCSLAFHPLVEPGNLMAALIFGDGAGAALVQAGEGPTSDGLEVIGARSTLVACQPNTLAFTLTDAGFYPVLSRDLVDVIKEPTRAAVSELLREHGLSIEDVGFWLVHPGGSRVLSEVEKVLCLGAGTLKWSWESLRLCGNMSSASIFDVMKRYLDDEAAPRGWGVVIGFGPGVSIEMLLVKRC